MDEEYTVKITETAGRQMREIMQYISTQLNAPKAAVQLLNLLERQISSLSWSPQRIERIEEEPWHSRGIRKMSVKNYLLYFLIEEEKKEVQIIAVLYGRRDQLQMLSQSDMDSTTDF
jgi:toxin ParE1/3/4